MAEGPSEFVIKIKPTTGGDNLTVAASKSLTIGELKDEISKQKSIPAEQIRLIYKGMQLDVSIPFCDHCDHSRLDHPFACRTNPQGPKYCR